MKRMLRTQAPQVSLAPPAIEPVYALAVVAPYAVNLGLNSDIWAPSQGLSFALFPDMDAAFHEYSEAMNLVDDRLGARVHDRLELAEWARARRYVQSAYTLGLVAGSRLVGLG